MKTQKGNSENNFINSTKNDKILRKFNERSVRFIH